MKTISIFAISMLVAAFAVGQNSNLEEIKVSAPQFNGVENAISHQNESANVLIKNYLKENVAYPEEAAIKKAEGTEVVQFTVTADGNVGDFKIINSVHPKIDEEIINALKNTNGMWLPGNNNGNTVDMTNEVSMVFCIERYNQKSVTEIFVEKATNYFNSGSVALFEKQNPKKALRFYTSGITYMPHDPSLLLLRGMCRYELGDKEGAIEDWNSGHIHGGIDMNKVTSQIKDMKGYDEMMAIFQK